MSLPVGLGDVALVVQGAVEVYHRIKGAKGTIHRQGENMESHGAWLTKAQGLLSNDAAYRAREAALTSQQRQAMLTILKRMRSDAKGIGKLFEKWEEANDAGRTWLSLRGLPGQLEELNGWVEDGIKRFESHLHLSVYASIHKRPLNGQAGGPGKQRGGQYSILFVDPANIGRSRVAEGYIKLLRAWSLKNATGNRAAKGGAEWPIKFCHSAGLEVKNRSDCVEYTERMMRPMYFGNQPPNERALNALFNRYSGLPNKTFIEKKMMSWKSRGLTRNMFSMYDYVVVFTRRDFNTLAALRNELGGDKAKLVILGRGKGNEVREIFSVRDGADERIWGRKLSEITVAVRGFLKREFGWSKQGMGAAN